MVHVLRLGLKIVFCTRVMTGSRKEVGQGGQLDSGVS